ncbi:substrate-binding protein [Bradyrhizobium sp. Rc2d]|nr:substrate-binding protein [Bradyrhizobium sp. Rc2d]
MELLRSSGKTFPMYRFRSAPCVVLTIALLAATMLAAKADEAGVSADVILFGQAAALEGPSSALGQRMRQGIVAAFTEINAKGGVHGRKLQLISRDDGYDPDRSVAQTLRLIEDDKVFALIGAVGTPTAMATIPITSARNVPFIGPFTGAEFLRDLELATSSTSARATARKPKPGSNTSPRIASSPA